MYIDMALGPHIEFGRLFAVEQAGIDPGVLAHGQRAVCAFGGDDQAQAAAELLGRPAGAQGVENRLPSGDAEVMAETALSTSSS